jgi:hypothetical protein
MGKTRERQIILKTERTVLLEMGLGEKFQRTSLIPLFRG